MCTFDRLHTMTTVVRSADTTVERRLEISDAVNRVDAVLYQSICIPDTEFNRSRRRHLQETLCLVTLVYASVVSEYDEGPQTEIFIYRFEKIWTGEGRKWGSIVIGIFRSLLVGEGYHSEGFMGRVLSLVDVSTKLAVRDNQDLNDLRDCTDSCDLVVWLATYKRGAHGFLRVGSGLQWSATRCLERENGATLAFDRDIKMMTRNVGRIFLERRNEAW